MNSLSALLRRLPFDVRIPPGTIALIGALVAVTVLAHIVGGGLVSWLVIGPNTLPGLRVTALGLNSLVEPGGSALNYIIVLAIGAFFLQHTLRQMWYGQRNDLIAVGAALIIAPLIISIFFPAIWGLAASAILLTWFAPGLERRWGRQRLWLFLAIIGGVTNTIGALLLWISPSVVGAIAGQGGVPPFGPGPLIDAMLTAFALSMGNQRLAVLNIEAYKLAYVLMAFAGFEMLFSGFASGLMSLTAVVLAWMLIRGMWRPKLLIDRIRLFFIDRRLARRRKGLKVVQGGKGKGDRTLHRDWSPA